MPTIGALSALLLLGLGYGLSSRAPRPRLLPIPNGYEDFVKAAGMVTDPAVENLHGASATELESYVQANAAALRLARTGCTLDCKVILPSPPKDLTYAPEHRARLRQFMKIAMLFYAEGQLAERQGRTNEAVRAYLAGMRFGQESCRGGLRLDRVLGASFEASAFTPMSNLVQHLDAPTVQEVAETLHQIEATRESWRSTLREDRQFFRPVMDFGQDWGILLAQMVEWCRSLWSPTRDPKWRVEEIQRWERQLLVQLRVRGVGRTPDGSE